MRVATCTGTFAEFTVELAEFDDNDKITGGLVAQIKELVLQYLIPVVCVEVNGPGSFAGKLLHQALKGNGCGGQEGFSITNKQKRILDAFEAPLSSRFLPMCLTVLSITRCVTLTQH